LSIENSNTKKSLKNIFSDLLLQVITMAFGVIIPKLFIEQLGSESNGLVSSINQILTYVALLEAGVGAAALQALFSPIKRDDRQKVSEILSATDFFYKRTGALYLSVLILLAFVFPFTIQSEISKYTISLVVLLSGVPSVISFFFQGKYSILLNAEGKNYIIKNLSIYIYILNSVLKIIFISCGFGIVLVQALGIIGSLIQVLYISIYIKKNYKWLDLKRNPEYNSIGQSKNALIHQVAWLITSNTDTILLAYFCNLKAVSLYVMYRMFFVLADNVINSLINGVHFLLGQTFSKDLEQYKKMHRVYECGIITLCFSLFCIVRIFILPFLSLYTSEIKDMNYIDKWLPYLFTIVHILVQSRATSWETISVSGKFKETQNQPIVEAIINFLVSVILVFPFGVYGVLIGTVVASLCRVIMMIEFSNRKILKISPWNTYKLYIINIIIFIFITYVSNLIIEKLFIGTYITIFIWAFVFAVIILLIFFCVTLAFNITVFASLKRYIKQNFAKYNKER